MEIVVPDIAVVVLMGASGSGKSTFARGHFRSSEILSSDYCRGLVADDENDQSVSREAFEILYFIARKRLEKGKLVVIDATNTQVDARKPLLALAREFHAMPVAIVLNMLEKLCVERNRARPDRNFAAHVVRNQSHDLRRSLRRLKDDGFRYTYIIDSPEQLAEVKVTRQRMWTNKKDDHGPFDIIGDVHGCFDELYDLLIKLGYSITKQTGLDVIGGMRYTVSAPSGRRAFFVGDLVDRGPKSNEVLRLVMDMVEAGVALCVPGNHEWKLHRKLIGKAVNISHGLAETLAQLEQESPEFIRRVKNFIDSLISHYVLDDGKLVVAHAGMKEAFQGRGSGAVRSFALYGETTGETDEFGLPVRYNWAQEYRGKAMVIYGHTPVAEPHWLNNTLCIDTGCVFGGDLTAIRYPERELVAVAARQTYYEPAKLLARPISPHQYFPQQIHDDLLNLDDVLGKRHLVTSRGHTILIREEQSLAALETMSRFAVNPKWVTYLPPTMSPTETSQVDGFLERPEETFAYYQRQGVTQLVCEEKHMGSRAIISICKNNHAARKHFGVDTDEIGICYTRTGRRFFSDRNLEIEFLERVRVACTHAGLWDELNTEWLTWDCELMPWSLKAKELIRSQYAGVGAAGLHALPEAIQTLAHAANRISGLSDLLQRYQLRLEHVQKFASAYRRYCWEVKGVDDLKLAPFHLLASADSVHHDKNHIWHLERAASLATSGDTLFVATPYLIVNLEDRDSMEKAILWWIELTEAGGEGMVVKPLTFIGKGRKGLAQPAIKCRGPEYLRIIYGPEYRDPEKLEQLRKRGLSTKRQLALREFELGLEGLERFVRHEPLRAVHECVLGVLALESEPLDPRL